MPPLCIVDRNNFLFQMCELTFLAVVVLLYQTGALRALFGSSEEVADKSVGVQRRLEMLAHGRAIHLMRLCCSSAAMCDDLCTQLLKLPLFAVRALLPELSCQAPTVVAASFGPNPFVVRCNHYPELSLTAKGSYQKHERRWVSDIPPWAHGS